jgi:hypothetical protein
MMEGTLAEVTVDSSTSDRSRDVGSQDTPERVGAGSLHLRASPERAPLPTEILFSVVAH